MSAARINVHYRKLGRTNPWQRSLHLSQCKIAVFGSGRGIRNNTNTTVLDTYSVMTIRCFVGTVPFIVSNHKKGETGWTDAEGIPYNAAATIRITILLLCT